MLTTFIIVLVAYIMLVGLVAWLAYYNHFKRQNPAPKRIELTPEQVNDAWPSLLERIRTGDLDEHFDSVPREEPW
jgi:hypothetical protein